jgi:hypothetical protein
MTSLHRPHARPPGARLPALRAPGLAAWWRPRLTAVLPDEPGALVVDLRSGAYAAAWRPRAATTVEGKASTAEGRPISHMAKAVRGTVARRLLRARRAPRTPADIAALADDGSGRVALHEPARRGGPWTVELIAAAASQPRAAGQAASSASTSAATSVSVSRP